MTLSTLPRVSCPQCGGYPDFDEEGKPYTCYFCCDAGTVEASVAEAYDRMLTDAAEKFAPRRLGIFVRMPVSEWDDICDEEAAAEEVPGHRLFVRLIPPAPFVRVAPTFLPDDDLPF